MNYVIIVIDKNNRGGFPNIIYIRESPPKIKNVQNGVQKMHILIFKPFISLGL